MGLILERAVSSEEKQLLNNVILVLRNIFKCIF